MKLFKLNSFIIWLSVLILAILFFVVILLDGLLLQKTARIDEALLSGQRVEVLLSDITASKRIKNNNGLAERKIDENAVKEPIPMVEDDKSVEGKAEVAVAEKKAETEPDDIQKLKGKKRAKVRKKSKYDIKLTSDPKLVVIVKGLGLSSSTTEMAFELPRNVTLGFTPYSPDISSWAAQADAEGFEYLVNVPMEVANYGQNDPGPYALLSTASRSENTDRLEMLANLVDGYIGVYTEKNEVFTNELTNVKQIFAILKENTIPIVYGKGFGNVTLLQYAQSYGVQVVPVDVDIDEEISYEAILMKLEQLESVAKKNGTAIAMARPYPITIRLLQKWSSGLENKQLQLVPISVLISESEDNNGSFTDIISSEDEDVKNNADVEGNIKDKGNANRQILEDSYKNNSIEERKKNHEVDNGEELQQYNDNSDSGNNKAGKEELSVDGAQ